MVLSPGARLGPYEVISPIGAGGMGEVYRARDTRLDRSVAIKILPSEVAENAQLKVRFEREARTISQLNHPNICTLYDVGENYLVMELLEGETLADRIARGPLPLAEVLRYGAEMAEALGKAHGERVVHRDLKPGNVMITKSGAKLLDFGLAKTATVVGTPDHGTATLQKPLTQEGTIVGTLQYMAPEQLAGEEPDARTDIFALGAVLYEMATGRRAFEGKTKASLIGAIVSGEPAPMAQMQPLTPPALEHVIRKCLAKDREVRWQSASDIAEELRWAGDPQSQSGAATPRRNARDRVLIAVTGAALIVAAVSGWSLWRSTIRQKPIARLAIVLPAATTLAGPAAPGVAVSADGKRVVYSGRSEGMTRLFVRQLDRFDSTALAGTETGHSPFFSPDGEWIAFFSIDGKLKRVRVSGGAVETLAVTRSNPRGGTWAPDGNIYYAGLSAGLWKVSVDNPKIVAVTVPNEKAGENSHRWPHMLPDGKHLLFTIRTDKLTSFDDARIAVLDLESGTWRPLFEGGMAPSYSPTGHLVFGQRGSIVAVPFDLKTLTVRGSPAPVVTDVVTDPSSGAAQYAIADRAGTLVYVSGGPVGSQMPLVAVNLDGKTNPIAVVPQRATSIRVSPDQKRLLFQIAAANDYVATYDLDRGTLNRVTFDPGDQMNAAWTPDGRRILFSTREGLRSISADGNAASEQLIRDDVILPPSCSPDGKWIAYSRHNAGKSDLALLPLEGERKSRPFVQTTSSDLSPMFSPDGKWISYMSDESGAFEIYLRPAGGGPRVQASIGGGMFPRWSRDGRQLFYIGSPGEFRSIAVGPSIGKPVALFTMPGVIDYDVFGQGLIVIKRPEETPQVTINVALNGLEGLRRP